MSTSYVSDLHVSDLPSSPSSVSDEDKHPKPPGWWEEREKPLKKGKGKKKGKKKRTRADAYNGIWSAPLSDEEVNSAPLSDEAVEKALQRLEREEKREEARKKKREEAKERRLAEIRERRLRVEAAVAAEEAAQRAAAAGPSK